MSTSRPFVKNPVLTAIAMGYKNATLIADDVLPRVPVGGEQFKYTVYNREDFKTENDLVGRAGRVNEIEFGADQRDGSVSDHGLESPIPQSDIDNAKSLANFDPKRNATMKLRKKIALSREARVAGLVFNAASYPTGNKVTVSGTDQWDDYANAKPLDQIEDAKLGMIETPNIFVMGAEVASHLRRNNQIVKAYHGNLGDDGMVPLAWLAELLGFEKILIGAARQNTAKKGQTETLARVWGKHAAMMYVDQNLVDTDESTFGMSPVFGGPVAMEKQDDNIGLRGGVRIRVGESISELLTAADLGYFFEAAVS